MREDEGGVRGIRPGRAYIANIEPIVLAEVKRGWWNSVLNYSNEETNKHRNRTYLHATLLTPHVVKV